MQKKQMKQMKRESKNNTKKESGKKFYSNTIML